MFGSYPLTLEPFFQLAELLSEGAEVFRDGDIALKRVYSRRDERALSLLGIRESAGRKDVIVLATSKIVLPAEHRSDAVVLAALAAYQKKVERSGKPDGRISDELVEAELVNMGSRSKKMLTRLRRRTSARSCTPKAARLPRSRRYCVRSRRRSRCRA